MNEEKLRAATIGEPTVHDGPINLADYDPVWPRRFATESERIRSSLGDVALAIEHVGSTSVPGLAAKPVIDILLAVPDSANEDPYVPAMVATGYVLRIRQPDWYEHRFLVHDDPKIQVHVFSQGCVEIDRMLAFRDRLRADEADRILYEGTKRELAARRWRYVQSYADAKTTVVEEILARALERDPGATAT
jgi:GrpB-like predicted nucleotidyltransferase (UPF0157 family)